jgi:enoyl-[acyl-carrier protein] reductase/trans-2-enoyl-CoA reductase (NAD+)
MTMQVLGPRGRGFVMVNAHPAGCAAEVAAQFAKARAAQPAPIGRRALVIGASTGYGLASRVSAAAAGMSTVGVFLERSSRAQRSASAGWYNTVGFHDLAGAGHISLNGDAFADDTKQMAIEAVSALGGPVDLVIYSLASPVRADPESGAVYRSVLKPIGSPYTTRSLDLDRGAVCEVELQPASEAEIQATVAVMGGADLSRWVAALLASHVVAREARVVAYSYIGPRLTWPIYRDGTVGQAKKDLEATVEGLNHHLAEAVDGRAVVSVNKAVVTQASAAIPAVPLYISLLYKIMKAVGTHEGPIDQILRLWTVLDHSPVRLDDQGRVRLDDLELDRVIQDQIEAGWPSITTDNLLVETDFDGYQHEFRRLFGFDVPGIDYQEPVEIDLTIPAWQ